MKDHHNAAALDPRYSEWSVREAMRCAHDPVQWVMDTYGDTLEHQFPVLVKTGKGHFLVIENPEEDACNETVHYVSPESFLGSFNIEHELKSTAATNIQVDERILVATWQSKLARRVFEELHPEFLQTRER